MIRLHFTDSSYYDVKLSDYDHIVIFSNDVHYYLQDLITDVYSDKVKLLTSGM